jgi:hypothetical protein
LSNIFFILFAINKLGFTKASIIVSFIMLVQLITDYPSGSLGDYIGQKWVLIIDKILNNHFILSVKQLIHYNSLNKFSSVYL